MTEFTNQQQDTNISVPFDSFDTLFTSPEFDSSFCSLALERKGYDLQSQSPSTKSTKTLTNIEDWRSPRNNMRLNFIEADEKILRDNHFN